MAMVDEQTLKRVECDPKCGFMVQSHEEEEVIEMTQKHAKMMHQMEATPEEIRQMMKTV